MRELVHLLGIASSLVMFITCTDNLNYDDNHNYANDYVDLGLSVKWAACNLGATSPEGYGSYYAWGETTTKTQYSWSTYKWCKGTYASLTKYNTKYDVYGKVDNLTELEIADDVARYKLGEPWRMPTKTEWEELMKNCEWKAFRSHGVYGAKVTSKINGKSIFLPAAGDSNTNYSDPSYWDNDGYYWSSTLDKDTPRKAISMKIQDSQPYITEDQRFYGCSIRAVRE